MAFNPYRTLHDKAAALATARELYKGGTPRWISHPEEFRAMAEEDYLESKELSDRMAMAHHTPNQDILTDYKPRLVNSWDTREFLFKLRASGVACFTCQTPPQPGIPSWLANTTGLFAVVPSQMSAGHQKICSMQIPTMFEWSVLLVDHHNLQRGQVIGWRTVLEQLICKRVMTEQRAHEVFGAPIGSRASLPYRKKLHEFRNGRGPQNDRPAAQ